MDIKKAIRALLQSKFGGVQLSDARVEQLAKRLEGKVETEEDLETRLVVLDEALPFADIAKEDDRIRSLEAAAKAKKPVAKKPVEREEEEEDDPDDEMPAWAKALIDGNKALQDTVQALKGEKVVSDRRSAILAKLKGADEAYANKVVRDFGRMSFADDEAFEEYLGDVENDFTEHAQSQAESKLGNDAPYLGSGGGNLKDDEVSPVMKQLVEQRKAEAEAKAKLN